MDRFQNTRQPDRDWWELLWPDPEQLLCDLSVDDADSLADIGCGDGYFTLPAAELLAPNPVYAIDIDVTLVDTVVRAAADRDLSNLHCIVGDARSVSSVLPDSLDAILIANTFHGVSNPTALVDEIRRSLRAGGRLIIVNWHDRPPEETVVAGAPRGPPADCRLSPRETCELVTTAAFEARETIDLPPHHYAIVFEQ